MSNSPNITRTVLDTVLGHIAPHFLASANDDLPTALHAASHLLAVYDVRTEEELHLATGIISFTFHALEALSESAGPDVSLNDKIRLRAGAVSLSREAHKAQRKLDRLKEAQRIAVPEVEALSERILTPDPVVPDTSGPEKPGADPAAGLAAFVRPASGKTGGGQYWSRSGQQRRAAERIAENLRRNKAEQVRGDAATAAAVMTTQAAARA